MNKNEAMRTISECAFPVIKKYMLKILIYSLFITYGYKALVYAIKNDFVLTYKFAVFYLSMIGICLMILEIVKRSVSYQYTSSPSEVCREDIELDDITIKTKACHEAGHFFIAKSLKMPVKEVNIIENGSVGGQLILDMPNVLKPNQIKNMVMVKYAGYLAEKILNGEVSDGCIGNQTSDIYSANILLRKYVILTDDSISLTGYESEYIEDKCIEFSKIWERDVEEMLKKGKKEVLEIAEELIETKVIKVAD